MSGTGLLTKTSPEPPITPSSWRLIRAQAAGSTRASPHTLSANASAAITTAATPRARPRNGASAPPATAHASSGRITKLEDAPPCEEMDVWTHRYYDASGIPASNDKVFDLPVGFKWNAGLPMNFDNPLRSANRYSSTRALVVDDGRCFTFSTVVYENLGEGRPL